MNFPLPPSKKALGENMKRRVNIFPSFFFARGGKKHWIYIFLFVQETKQLTGDIFGKGMDVKLARISLIPLEKLFFSFIFSSLFL